MYHMDDAPGTGNSDLKKAWLKPLCQIRWQWTLTDIHWAQLK